MQTLQDQITNVMKALNIYKIKKDGLEGETVRLQEENGVLRAEY